MANSSFWGALAVFMLVAGATVSANAQQIDPRRIASCQLAAENMRDRVRQETADFVRYNDDASYWIGQVERFVPDEAPRRTLLTEGQGELRQALQGQGYMAGMMMVSQVLQQCNSNRSVIESATPNG